MTETGQLLARLAEDTPTHVGLTLSGHRLADVIEGQLAERGVPVTPRDQLVAELAIYAAGDSSFGPGRSLPKHRIVATAEAHGVTTVTIDEIRALRDEAAALLCPELRAKLNPDTRLEVEPGFTAARIMEEIGPGPVPADPTEAALIVKLSDELVAQQNPEVIAEIADAMYCLLAAPAEVEAFVKACIDAHLDPAKRRDLAASGSYDAFLSEAVRTRQGTTALNAQVKEIAAAPPASVSPDVAAALNYLVPRSGQGQVHKIATRCRKAVMHNLTERAAASPAPTRVPTEIVSYAACVPSVLDAVQLEDGPRLPSKTAVHREFKRVMGRGPKGPAAAACSDALDVVAELTGWPTGDSEAVRTFDRMAKQSGWTRTGREVPVAGHLASTTCAFDREFEFDTPDTHVTVIVEIDGGHHTGVVEIWDRPLEECRRADVDKARSHLNAHLANGAHKPILVIDSTAVDTKRLEAELEALLPSIEATLARPGTAMVAVGRVGKPTRAVPCELLWDRRVVGNVQIWVGRHQIAETALAA